ncbi:MAG: hypothetical protein IJ491_03570 [Clostridia bacterium]|nr:hypothetical protein [Clostridia bacterium]
MDENKNTYDFIPEEITKAVSIALVIILLFTSGTLLGKIIGKENTVVEEGQEVSVSSTVSQTTTTQPTSATTLPPATTTTAPATQQTETTAPAVSGEAQTTVPAAASTAPSTQGMTTAEIIALFNESANRVKTDATKVVKNYEKRTHNEEHLIAPSAVEGMLSDFVAENFKDDTEPIEYATREDIVANYQVPGVEWASQLTEAEVAEATCTDNGTEYEIMLSLHPTENPEPGVGVAKAFDTITSSEIMAKAPSFLTGFNTNYTSCVVKCKIDKATGRTTWSNYTSSVILAVTLNFLGSNLDAQMGMTFEKDYTITY